MYYTQARIGGLRVAGLMGEPKPDGVPVGWTTYFATDDVDGTVKRITDSGGTVTMAPEDVMDQGRMAMAADPQGAVFGLWQAGRHFGSALVNEPGTICWNELMTPDLEATRRFYSAVFGYDWEDIDATVDTARQLGGAISVPATDSSYGRFAILRDPQGGAFAIIRLAEES